MVFHAGPGSFPTLSSAGREIRIFILKIGSKSMDRPMRIVHYLNQFFGQIGGEDKADTPCQVRLGPIGPGILFQQLFGDRGEIAATIICGDNFAAQSLEETGEKVAAMAAELTPDLFLAGPAFSAGRYGLACGAACQAVGRRLGISAVTGMSEDNPAVQIYRSHAYIVPTGRSSAGMREAASKMVGLSVCLAEGHTLRERAHFPRGIRELAVLESTGAKRAVDMLVARLAGRPVMTELPLPRFEKVPPAPPLEDITQATIILATEGGIIPAGNPDGIEMSMATKFGKYSLSGLDRMTSERFTAAHGGYDNQYAKADPNVLIPLDVLRELVAEGKIAALGEDFYTTAGNATSVENASRFGKEIAEDIRRQHKEKVGVILTAT
jgi:glycine reductase